MATVNGRRCRRDLEQLEEIAVPRRPDPDRIATARREATLASVRSAGIPSPEAVGMVVDAESAVRARGLDRHSREYWEAVRTLVDERLR